MPLPATTMQAAILVQQHQPLVVGQVKLPESLEPGQVLVRVDYSGICGSQVGEIDGVKGPDRFLPHLLGHEGAGIVFATGPGVTHVQEGQHVVMHWRKGPGIDAPPPCYQFNERPLHAGWVTTFNEWAIISENRLTSIPVDFPLDQAALFGCPVTTGLGVVTRDARLTLGESIVVLGAGGVGLSVIQGALLAGAHPIIAVDVNDRKLALARDLGATEALHADAADLKDRILDSLGSAGADVVVENTGNAEVIELAYELTHAQGRLILVGVPPKDDRMCIPSLPLHFGKVITGSHGGGTQPHLDIPRYVKLAKAGKLDLQRLITHRFRLEQINEAIDMLRQGEITGRAIIEFDHAGARA